MDVNTFAQQVVTAASNNSQQVQALLINEGTAIAKALTPYVITAELTFVGLRIVFRESVVAQMVHFTTSFIILFIVVYMQFPQNLMINVSQQLNDAGKELGYKIASTSQSSPILTGSATGPASYWVNWIGDVSDDTSSDSKFGLTSLKRRFQPTGSFDQIMNLLEKNFNLQNAAWWQGVRGLIDGVLKLGGSAFNFVLGPLIVICSLGFIFGVVAAYASALLAPAFAYIAVICGSQYVFAFAIGMGISLVPLLFLKAFKDIWQKYLIFTTSILLIPPLFYILSGIGYAFATTIYEAMFPMDRIADGYGQIIHNLLESVYAKLFNLFLSGGIEHFAPGLGTMADPFGAIMVGIMSIFKQFGYVLLASSIVTAFVLVGISLGLAAPAVAFRWCHAFNSEDLMHRFSTAFGVIQSAIGNSYSQMWGEEFQGVFKGVRGFYDGSKGEGS